MNLICKNWIRKKSRGKMSCVHLSFTLAPGFSPVWLAAAMETVSTVSFRAQKTVETVSAFSRLVFTSLKRGVNVNALAPLRLCAFALKLKND
jgi:hypothetical protein